jgi:hypothetical protein
MTKMPDPILLHIHEEAVRSYIQPGGEVNDLLNRLAKEVKRYSYLYILGGHVRSGRLLGGLNWKQAWSTGPLSAVSRAGSSAKHTEYFMFTTRPEIKAHGPFMLVPKYRKAMQVSSASKGAGSELFAVWNANGRKRGRGFFRAQEVRGYRGHPFLQEGLDAALAKERL